MQLACRFALPPNAKGYCGRNSAPAKFIKCIEQGSCEEVMEEIEKFIVLHPYLKTIADIVEKNKFDYDVIEAYWLGNDLLKKIKPFHYDLLLENFAKQGVPDFFIKTLQEEKPKGFVPTHLFQVIHVGVGRASGVVPFNLASINECMIRWGKVLEINNKSALVLINSLKQEAKMYVLATEEVTINLESGLESNLQVGQAVAVHWGNIIKVLNDVEIEKIEFWTNKTLDACNQ